MIVSYLRELKLCKFTATLSPVALQRSRLRRSKTARTLGVRLYISDVAAAVAALAARTSLLLQFTHRVGREFQDSRN